MFYDFLNKDVCESFEVCRKLVALLLLDEQTKEGVLLATGAGDVRCLLRGLYQSHHQLGHH